MYVQSDIEEPSCNRRYRVSYSGCVFVALGTQDALSMHMWSLRL